MNLGSVLHVYKGEYGLPSIDFECLRAMCLIKFTRCPIRVETDGNPFGSGAGKLPYLQIGNKKFVGYRQIKQVLDTESFSVDANLQMKDLFMSPCWAEWAFTNLHSCYNYYLYGDPNNYDIIRSLYARRTPFPFNFYYPSNYQRDAAKIIQVMSNFDIYDKVETHPVAELTSNAKKAITLLSKKLGKKVWFFGDMYSEFDAIVYSYLAILYHLVLPNNPLKNHIKACKNLVSYINRITKDVFKNETFTSPNVKRFPKSDSFLTPTEQRFLESETKTKIFSAIGAVVAMSSYFAWRKYSNDSKSNRIMYTTMDYDDDGDDSDLE